MTEEEEEEEKKENGIETKFLGLKIPKNMLEAMNEYIRRDTHMNKSDFVRNTIREKLESKGIVDELMEKNKDRKREENND